jgi:ethanolamine kinase
LLCGNVIVQPRDNNSTTVETTEIETVNFIDYEYATPSPAVFDIANHFAEWAGFECDYNMLPARSVRREFLREYVKSYDQHLKLSEGDHEKVVDQLFKGVDRFRGIPGFYWYAVQAESRLSKYELLTRRAVGVSGH